MKNPTDQTTIPNILNFPTFPTFSINSAVSIENKQDALQLNMQKAETSHSFNEIFNQKTKEQSDQGAQPLQLGPNLNETSDFDRTFLNKSFQYACSVGNLSAVKSMSSDKKEAKLLFAADNELAYKIAKLNNQNAVCDYIIERQKELAPTIINTITNTAPLTSLEKTISPPPALNSPVSTKNTPVLSPHDIDKGKYLLINMKHEAGLEKVSDSLKKLNSIEQSLKQQLLNAGIDMKALEIFADQLNKRMSVNSKNSENIAQIKETVGKLIDMADSVQKDLNPTADNIDTVESHVYQKSKRQ